MRERECDSKPHVPSNPAPVEALASHLPGSLEAGRATTSPCSLDLLRLSYVCRADARLGGMPERSWVLSKIHRFFDNSPDPVAALELSLSALIDGAKAGMAARSDG